MGTFRGVACTAGRVGHRRLSSGPAAQHREQIRTEQQGQGQGQCAADGLSDHMHRGCQIPLATQGPLQRRESRIRAARPSAVPTDGLASTCCRTGTTRTGTASTAASPAIVDRKIPAASTPAQAHPTTSPHQLTTRENQSAGTRATSRPKTTARTSKSKVIVSTARASATAPVTRSFAASSPRRRGTVRGARRGRGGGTRRRKRAAPSRPAPSAAGGSGRSCGQAAATRCPGCVRCGQGSRRRERRRRARRR